MQKLRCRTSLVCLENSKEVAMTELIVKMACTLRLNRQEEDNGSWDEKVEEEIIGGSIGLYKIRYS